MRYTFLVDIDLQIIPRLSDIKNKKVLDVQVLTDAVVRLLRFMPVAILLRMRRSI